MKYLVFQKRDSLSLSPLSEFFFVYFLIYGILFGNRKILVPVSKQTCQFLLNFGCWKTTTKTDECL